MNKKFEKLLKELNKIKTMSKDTDIQPYLNHSYDLLGSLIYEMTEPFDNIANNYDLSDTDRKKVVKHWDIYHGDDKLDFIALFCEFGIKKAHYLMKYHFDDRRDICKEKGWL